MELKLLQTFLAVARRLSFHRAAEEQHFSQSTISAHIRELEEELGRPLFDRLGRRIRLTEAGERLVDYAKRMLELDEEARAELTGAGEVRTTLTVRIPESLAVHRLPPVIKEFNRLRPRVSLNVTTCAHDGLRQDFRQGLTDLAFLLTDSFQAAELRVEFLATEPLLLVSSPGHPLASREGLVPSDLAGQTLLLTKIDCSYRRLLENLLAQEEVSPGLILEFHSLAAVKAAVAAGLGLTILPEMAAAEETAQGRLKALSWAREPLEAALLMIWHRDRWLSPSLSAFMDLIRENLRQRSD